MGGGLRGVSDIFAGIPGWWVSGDSPGISDTCVPGNIRHIPSPEISDTYLRMAPGIAPGFQVLFRDSPGLGFFYYPQIAEGPGMLPGDNICRRLRGRTAVSNC